MSETVRESAAAEQTEARRPRVGDRFEHARQLDPDWQPGPGQRHADAPHRVMVVTRVARPRGHRDLVCVYYRPDDGGRKGLWSAELSTFPTVVGRWL